MNINKSLLLAKQHHKSNNLNEAKMMYLEILNKFPASKVAKKELKRINTKINQVVSSNIPDELMSNLNMLYSKRLFKESLDESIRLSKIYPSDPFVYNIMAPSFYGLNQLENAIESYEQAIKIKPDYIDAHNNMGSLLMKVGRNDEAIESFKLAIKVKPDFADPYNNMGIALMKTGQNEKALESYRQAISINHNNKKFIRNLIFMLIQSFKVEDIEQYCESEDSYYNKIILIIYLFINTKSFDRIKSLVIELREMISKDTFLSLIDRDKVFIMAYLGFIDKLNSNILENRNEFNCNIEENILYHVGDSHSLTFAHQNLYLENENYTIKPLIIIGTKAWHLGNKNKNQYKTFFENYIDSLKVGSKLILSFGEIDCRINEGIMNYHLKTKNDLNDIVYKTVKDYVDYSENILNELQIKRIYVGIPAPVIKVFNNLNTLRIEIVKLFNKSLMEITKNRKLNFLDVYTLTVNSDGSSNEIHMCDDYHLKPSSINELKLEFK